MSRSIKDISEELGRMNLEHEIHYKGKELNLNSGKNNDQHYVRRVDTNCVYFVKKGGCRYGSSCRFIHPEQKMDLGTNHSSLDPQRQIPLLGSLKEEASSQVVSGEGQQKAGSLMCRADSQVLPNRGIPTHVPYRIPFPEEFNIPVGSTGLPLRPADSQVLPNRGIPTHVPYRIPFPEEFNIPVGSTGLPLRPVGSQVLPREGIPMHVPYRIPFPAKFSIPVSSTGLPLRAADSQVLPNPNRGIPIHVPYRIPFPEKFNIPVGPTGLPLRPDRPVCKYYSHFGLCKYGIVCPDDHPIDFKSIAVPVPKRSSKSKKRSE